MSEDIFKDRRRSATVKAPVEVNIVLPRLQDLILQRLSEEDLRQLCYELGVEYADLEGSTRQAKARALIDLCDRHDRLQELLQACINLRPNQSWIDEPAANQESTGVQKSEGRGVTGDGVFVPKRVLIGFIVIIAVATIGWGLMQAIDNSVHAGDMLIPRIAYDFRQDTLPRAMRSATTDFTTDIKVVDQGAFGLFGNHKLAVQLSLPTSSIGEALSTYSGGVCVPTDLAEPFHAVSARVQAPEGASSLRAIFTANGDDVWYFSGPTVMEPGKWMPMFWGTEFGYFGDEWHEWSGYGAHEVCVWFNSSQPYSGPVYLDDLIIYELATDE